MAGAAPGTTFGVDFICCQTKGCGKPSLSFSSQTKGFKRVKPFKICQASSWSCQYRGCGKPIGSFSCDKAAVASQVFLFLLARNARLLLPNPANPSNSSKRAKAAKLEAVASQVGAKLAAVVPFLVPNCCCCCQTSGSTCPKLPDAPAKSCKPLELFETGQSCQIRGCVSGFGKPSGCKTSGRGKPSLSFSTGPKLPDAPSKPFKRFKRFKPLKSFKPLKPLETCQTGYWSCQTQPSPANPSNSSKRAKAAKLEAVLEAVASQVGAKLAAVASQVFLFLLARNCRMLPPNPSNASNASNPSNLSNPSNPSKRAKPAIVLPN